MKSAELLSKSSLSLPADSCIYKILSVTGNDSVATISSNDALRVIDNSLQVLPNGAVENIHRVTCLENFETRPGCLVTAGDDAVSVWDPRTPGLETLQIRKGSDAPYLALASAGHRLAVGTELGGSQAIVGVWDYRAPKDPLVRYVESHNDDVTKLCFHPSNSSWLLSGSTDGLINIFDTTITDEDEALLQITNHGSSIHHAGFLSPTEFYALSHDEIFSIYQLDTTHDETTTPASVNFGNFRATLNCDYVVGVVKLGDGTAVVGAGSHSKQQLDLVPLRLSSAWALDTQGSIRLPTAHGDDIVRSMCFDHAGQTVFTGGEDGMVNVWRLPVDHRVPDVQSSEESKTSKKRKKNEDSRSEKARFKPY